MLHKRYGGLTGRPIGSARLTAYSAGKFAAAVFTLSFNASSRMKMPGKNFAGTPFLHKHGNE